MSNTSKAPRATRATKSKTTNSYPVELLDPALCRPSGLNREIFADDTWNVLTGLELPGEGLTESIIKTGGNLENGIVVRQPEPDERGCEFEILSGHRRWTVCLENKLPFRALVLPADTTAEVQVSMAVWANASQRDQSPIDRIRAAKHVEPQIREALKENKFRGTRLELTEDGEPTYQGRFDDVVSRLFFEGSRKEEWCRQLRMVFEASTGEGTLLDVYPEDRDRNKAQERAREYVNLIHTGHMTVGETFRKMQAVKKPRVASDGRVMSPDEEKVERKAAAARSALVSAISGLAQIKDPPVDLSDAEVRMIKDGAPVAMKILVAAFLAVGGTPEVMIGFINDAPKPEPKCPARSPRKRKPAGNANLDLAA